MRRWMMTLALAASLGVAGASARTPAAPADRTQAPAAKPAADAKTAAAVKAAELKRFAAMTSNDFATLGALLADDLVYTHSNAKVDSKSTYLETLTSGKTKYEVIDPGELDVRLFGTMAIIHGTAKMRVATNGEIVNNHLRFTDVWEQRGGTWQMVTWQSTRIP